VAGFFLCKNNQNDKYFIFDKILNMNNLKKLKLLVASALLSSTAVYADDCTDTSATNCGIISQVIKPLILVLY
jgi:uncharacterized protein YerC